MLDGDNLIFPWRQGPDVPPTTPAVIGLQWRNLRTNSEHIVSQGQPGHFLIPLALEWPRLVWADHTFGADESEDLFATDANGVGNPSTEIHFNGVAPVSLVLGGAIYFFDQTGITRFQTPDARPKVLWTGGTGAGIQEFVITQGALAWTTQTMDHVNVLDLPTGLAYQLQSPAFPLLAMPGALVWESVVSEPATPGPGSHRLEITRLELP
jgi:hypothetical protein